MNGIFCSVSHIIYISCSCIIFSSRIRHSRRVLVTGVQTCARPISYSGEGADRLVEAVRRVPGLDAYRLEQPLYADSSHPVVVVAVNVELEADGTIKSRDALAWFVQLSAAEATGAQVAETGWNVR